MCGIHVHTVNISDFVFSHVCHASDMFLSLEGSESLCTLLTLEQISLMYIFVCYYDEHFCLILGFYFRIEKVVGVEEEVEGVEEVEEVEGVEEVESLPQLQHQSHQVMII